MATQNLISVLNVTLGAGAEVTLPHGLVSASSPVAPFEVTCDRPSTIGVLSATDTSVAFKNHGAAETTAAFRVVREHSVSTDPKVLVAWRGWDGTASPVGPAGGDLFGTYPNPLVYGLEGYPIEGPPPSNGDAIIFNSALGIWEHAPITFGGGPPVGPASRDLGGVYPDPLVVGLQNSPLAPTVADGFIKRNAGNTAWEEVAYGSAANTVCVGNDPRLSDGRNPVGVASGDLAGLYPAPTVAKLNTYPLDLTAPVAGDYLRFDGTTWRHTLVSPGSQTAIYGAFSANVRQPLTTGVNVVNFDTTEGSNGVTLVAGNRLQVTESGVYGCDISPQLFHGGGGTELIKFWLRVDGVDLPRSASSLEMGNNNNRTLPFLQIDLPLNAGQYIQWVFTSSTGSDIALEYYAPVLSPPAAFAVPAIPAAIANVKRIGSIA